jgi:tellurite resistance protein
MLRVCYQQPQVHECRACLHSMKQSNTASGFTQEQYAEWFHEEFDREHDQRRLTCITQTQIPEDITEDTDSARLFFEVLQGDLSN